MILRRMCTAIAMAAPAASTCLKKFSCVNGVTVMSVYMGIIRQAREHIGARSTGAMIPEEDARRGFPADAVTEPAIQILPLSCLHREDDPGNIQIDSDILESMVMALSQDSRTEQGGFLGMDTQGIITGFFHDRDARRDETGYTPSSTGLADAMGQWQDLSFAGIIHTHSAMPRLSRGDLVYTQRLLECNPGMERLIMGLLVDGKLQMYLFERDFIPWLDRKLKHNEPLYRSQM